MANVNPRQDARRELERWAKRYHLDLGRFRIEFVWPSAMARARGRCHAKLVDGRSGRCRKKVEFFDNVL